MNFKKAAKTYLLRSVISTLAGDLEYWTETITHVPASFLTGILRFSST